MQPGRHRSETGIKSNNAPPDNSKVSTKQGEGTSGVSAVPVPHPSLFHRVRRIVDGITMALNVVGTLLIVAIMILVNADVIGRGFLDSPISGVPEIVSMSIVAIVFLQVAQTFRMGKLTRSAALLSVLQKRSPRIRALAELIFCLAALGIMVQLFRASVPLFTKSWVRNTFEGTIGDFTAPIWPVKLVILIGCSMLIVQLLIAAVLATQTLFGGSDTSAPGSGVNSNQTNHSAGRSGPDAGAKASTAAEPST